MTKEQLLAIKEELSLHENINLRKLGDDPGNLAYIAADILLKAMRSAVRAAIEV